MRFARVTLTVAVDDADDDHHFEALDHLIPALYRALEHHPEVTLLEYASEPQKLVFGE